MNDHARPDRTGLNALLWKAEDGVGFAMRKIGRVPPTFVAATPSGLLSYFPITMADARAKDNLANTARLICAAYAATAAVLMFEAWMRLASVWSLAARERNGGGAEECSEWSRSGASRAKGQTEAPRSCAPALQP